MSFIYFLISSELEIIKRKFIALYILNAADIFFTLLLLSEGMFGEKSPFMMGIIDNSAISIFMKFGLTLLLLFLECSGIYESIERHLMMSNLIITTCMLFYFFINLSHIVWCCRYLLF